MRPYMFIYWALNTGFGRAKIALNYSPYSHEAMSHLENMISEKTGNPYICVVNIIPIQNEEVICNEN